MFELTTMTFEVQRAHPGKLWSGTPAERNLRAAVPFEVEVEGPYPRTGYKMSACGCQFVYVLTEGAVEWLRKHELLRGHLAARGAERPVVCKCVGRILE